MNEVFSGAGGWWLGSALGGGAVLLICGLLMRRTPSPAARQRLGEWGIVAAVLVAVLRMGPSWIPVPDPWSEQQPEVAATPCAVIPMTVSPQLAFRQQPKEVVCDTPSFAGCVPEPESVELVTSHEKTQAGWTIGLIDGLLAGYAALAVFFFSRWLLGQWGLARILRRSRPAPESVQHIFDQLVGETGQKRVRLLVSDRVPVPMCCGLSRPTVVIPLVVALECDPKVLRWVFAHELTHLARRDTWSMWFMGLAQTFYFYLPLFWWVRRHVRLCQEYIADAAAARQGPWADDYAQFLVSLARSPAAPMGATGVLGNTSDLYRRVTMLLKPTKAPASPASRRQLLGGVSCLIASAIILAGLGVRAETPDDKKDKKDVDVIVDVKPVDVIQELVVVLDDDKTDDDKKKEGDKQDLKLKRVQPVQPLKGVAAVGAIDTADIEKKIRTALENADLNDADIKKVMKEIHQALEQAHQKIHMELMPKLAELKLEGAMPKIAQFQDFKALPGGEFKFVQPAQGAWVMQGAGGGGRLGVTIEKPSQVLVEHLDLSKDQGIVIQQVTKGSAAEKAGFKANDILLKFADKSVSSDAGKFIKLIDGLESDKEFSAVVLRKGKKEVIDGIKLGEKKKAASMLGDKVIVEANDADVAKKFRALAELHAKDGEKHAADAKKFAEIHIKEAAKHADEAKKIVAEVRARADAKKSDNSEQKSNRSVSVTVKDGEYSAKESEGELTITVTGKMDDGKVAVSSITINDGGEKTNYKSLDKVPSKYRARIEKLIAGSGDSPVRVRVRTDRDDD